MSADRNLLIGILALQLGFISREQLISAFHDWVLQKQRPLDEILAAQGALGADARPLLQALVAKHVELHGGSVEQSLASVSSIGSVHDELKGLADPELTVTLAHVARGTRALDATIDHPNSQVAKASVGSKQADGLSLRFKILRPHAKGGLGEVFVAKDQELNREVALKEIQPKFADDTGSRSRFRLEAEVTGNLEHPGIVPVYGLGQYADGRPFYAMRFIRGASLKEAIEQFHTRFPASKSPMSEGEAVLELRKLLGRFVDVCNAIEYAHSRGVLHRDLKPGNVVLGKYGETLVVDWGLAKALGKTEIVDASQAPVTPSSESGSAPTMLGSAIGTPAYMSPEQAAGRVNELGPATDVYSLGATLYHLLTGQTPVQGKNVAATLQYVQSGEYPTPRQVRADVPRPLEAVCLRAMALKAENRYAAPLALAEDIERWLADEPVKAHRESIFSHASRWIRKHRAWAMSGGVALALVALVSSVAAVWINGQKEVIAKQERAATELAGRNFQLATEKSSLAENEKLARAKAEASVMAEKQAKEEEARQRLLANMAAMSEKLAKEEEARQRMIATAAAETERKLRILADQETKRANDEVDRGRRQLYSAHMNLAQFAWDGFRAGEAERLLDQYRPRAGQEIAKDLRGFEWYYWDRLCRSERITFKGHNAAVTNVAYSTDGKRLASASYDQTVKVWDTTSGEVIHTLKGHTGMVWSLAFSPDGKRLVSAGWDREARVWDTNSAQELRKISGRAVIYWLAFSPDGKWLASGNDDGTVQVWDAASGMEKMTFTGHTAGVRGVSFSPDSKRLASASDDRTVKVWDITTSKEVLTSSGHTGPAVSVSFSPDGKHLASAGGYRDGTIKLWDATNGREARTLIGHSSGVTSVAFDVYGKRLVSASADNTLRVWDVISGQEILTIKKGLQDSGVLSVNMALSTDGKRLASAGFGGTIKEWDARISLEALKLQVPGWVKSVAFSPNGEQLAAAVSAGFEMPGEVKVWDVSSGQEVLSLKGHTCEVNCVVFGRDGNRLASASGAGNRPDKRGEVKLWDAITGVELRTMRGHTQSVNSVALSRDGKRLASASADQTVMIWDTTTGKNTLTLKGHTSSVVSVAFSPDGKHLASSSLDNTAKVWDAASGEDLLTFKGHTAQVLHITFSDDGKFLASASTDRTVKIWDVESGHEKLTLNGHAGPVMSIGFSPNGKRLVSASSDQTVKVWDVVSGLEMLTLNGHASSVDSVAFSPDGTRLASAGTDQTVRVWDARPWTPELRADHEALSLIHFLRDQGKSKAEWLDAIAADQTISELVRQSAMKFAREWKP